MNALFVLHGFPAHMPGPGYLRAFDRLAVFLVMSLSTVFQIVLYVDLVRREEAKIGIETRWEKHYVLD